MTEAGDFAVDLDALGSAAEGIAGVLAELEQHQVEDIDCDRSAFGHDPLAATTTDFCDRWQRGVKHLAEDGQQIADRLVETVNTYSAAEQTALGALHDAAGGGA